MLLQYGGSSLRVIPYESTKKNMKFVLGEGIFEQKNQKFLIF